MELPVLSKCWTFYEIDRKTVMDRKEKRYILNISGTKYEVSATTFTKVLTSTCIRLSEIDENNEIFIERHPACMAPIVAFYQGRTLHMPAGVCPNEFKEELDYWGIPHQKMARCCFSKMVSFFDDQRQLDVMESEEKSRKTEATKLTLRIKDKGWKRFQAQVWQFLEEPSTSKAAKVCQY